VARLTRFDVAEYSGIFMVVIESELLPPDYPAVQHLNPELLHEGQPLILATRLIASVRRAALRRRGSLAEQAERITRAVDVLMAGV
jgi:toxin CcdB